MHWCHLPLRAELLSRRMGRDRHVIWYGDYDGLKAVHGDAYLVWVDVSGRETVTEEYEQAREPPLASNSNLRYCIRNFAPHPTTRDGGNNSIFVLLQVFLGLTFNLVLCDLFYFRDNLKSSKKYVVVRRPSGANRNRPPSDTATVAILLKQCLG